MLSDIHVNCIKLFDDICGILFTTITYKSFASVFALVFPSLSRLRGSKTFLLTTHTHQMSSPLHSNYVNIERWEGGHAQALYNLVNLYLVYLYFILGWSNLWVTDCSVLAQCWRDCDVIVYLYLIYGWPVAWPSTNWYLLTGV